MYVIASSPPGPLSFSARGGLSLQLVVLLQAAHLEAAAVDGGEGAHHGPDTGQGRDAGDTVGDSRRADRGVVLALLLAVGRVEDQVDLPVLEHVHDVRTALVDLVFADVDNDVGVECGLDGLYIVCGEGGDVRVVPTQSLGAALELYV